VRADECSGPSARGHKSIGGKPIIGNADGGARDHQALRQKPGGRKRVTWAKAAISHGAFELAINFAAQVLPIDKVDVQFHVNSESDWTSNFASNWLFSQSSNPPTVVRPLQCLVCDIVDLVGLTDMRIVPAVFLYGLMTAIMIGFSGSAQEERRRAMTHLPLDKAEAPRIVDRAVYQAELDELRLREKAHTTESDAIAAARRRLPMVEVNSETPLIGKDGAVTLLDAFEGRQMLIAYYLMWRAGKPAAEQCEGCTIFTSQIRELSYIHARDVTYATFCQGPYEEGARYRDFMGWEMPWYSAPASLETLLVGRRIGMMHLICYLRRGDRVFETYWTWMRGVEAMDNNYRLLDLTVYGRQEKWEDSPAGWPQWWEGKQRMRTDGRPTAQWARLKAGYSDDLSPGRR
jgi:predicted dithiol-disulfide oxidoreductase (DUF899 family)